MMHQWVHQNMTHMTKWMIYDTMQDWHGVFIMQTFVYINLVHKICGYAILKRNLIYKERLYP